MYQTIADVKRELGERVRYEIVPAAPEEIERYHEEGYTEPLTHWLALRLDWPKGKPTAADEAYIDVSVWPCVENGDTFNEEPYASWEEGSEGGTFEETVKKLREGKYV